MIKQFQKLSNEERELLFNAPVLISVLASCSLNDINVSQRSGYIKMAHLKTFTAILILGPYYEEVEKDFNERFEAATKKYFPFDQNRRIALKKEIVSVNFLIERMNTEYAYDLQKSLEEYTRHIRKAAYSIFRDFIFPVPLTGLTV